MKESSMTATADSSDQVLAIVGVGPSTVYLLKHLKDRLERSETDSWLKVIHLLEQSAEAGTGMAYSRSTTSVLHLCNIASEELPDLGESFADWLVGLDSHPLEQWGIQRSKISESETYPRVALGQYFRNRMLVLCDELRQLGVSVQVHERAQVSDITIQHEAEARYALMGEGGKICLADRVVIATGHHWEVDQPESGYYASPWPIQKFDGITDQLRSDPVGLLGASLSAFDVAYYLACQVGEFVETEGDCAYRLAQPASGFQICMHAAHGWLPQLQYEQENDHRRVYRHYEPQDLSSLCDENGWLRLETYFNQVCRPAFQRAFVKDHWESISGQLPEDFTLEQFITVLVQQQSTDQPFLKLKEDLVRAEAKQQQESPSYWKEVFDDLMYGLNFHYHWLPAEDHRQLQEKVMPMLMNVIAALPLVSARRLLALHAAGCLELVPGKVTIDQLDSDGVQVQVENEAGEVSTSRKYRTFIDCSGQPALKFEQFPFTSLVESQLVLPASKPNSCQMANPETLLESSNESDKTMVGGLAIDPLYRVIGKDGVNQTLFDIAFPHIKGLRPYSYGLQAGSEVAELVAVGLLKTPPGNLTLQQEAEIYRSLKQELPT